MGDSTERRCIDCGAPLVPSGAVRKRYRLRCPDCVRQRKAELARNAYRQKVAMRNAGRVCVECGVPVERNGNQWPERCPEHRDAYRIVSARRRTAAWRKKYPEREQERARRYAEAHPGVNLARVKAWRAANPERAKALRRAAWSRYNARKRGATVTDEKFTLDEIYERDDRTCGLCEQSVERVDATVDHIIPVSRGGLHALSNVQLAHRSCNTRKGNRIPTG